MVFKGVALECRTNIVSLLAEAGCHPAAWGPGACAMQVARTGAGWAHALSCIRASL